MSAIVKTEAIVLRALRYRESSKIVTFFTRRYGKVTAIAKGALGPRSSYGASLEPMSYSSIVLYMKDAREIQTLSQSDLLRPWRRIPEDLSSLSSGMKMIELVNSVSEPHHESRDLFSLLLEGFFRLEDETKNPQITLYIFETRLADVLGYGPDYTRCTVCRRKIADLPDPSPMTVFHLERGAPICQRCSDTSGPRLRLSAGALDLLRRLSDPGDGGTGIETDKKTRDEVESFLWSYLKFHIPGLKELKTTKVFSKIEQR